jgi:DNA-binding CsgD family transcriptional regulator
MPELRLSAAAQRILADVRGGDDHLHRVLARPPRDGCFSRRTEVELASGERGMLHAHSSPMPDGDEALVTVLELQHEQPGVSPGRLAALTPREADVAKLTIDGLSDREIAERLCLSHHTVGQHLKRIYRKLEVDSRVALTRLLLGVPRTVGHT